MSNLLGRSGSSTLELPLAQVPAAVASLELTRGESLYRRGDAATDAYRVEAGLLKLFVNTEGGRERIMSLVGPGDYLGSIDPQLERRQENAEALSRSVRVSLLARPLNGQLGLTALSSQLQQLRDALEDSELPVPARLARTFSRLGDRFGQTQSDGSIRLTLPLTHDNLAAMVGAARETTSFVLAAMRRSGVVSGTRGVYTFKPVAMREFAAQNTVG